MHEQAQIGLKLFIQRLFFEAHEYFERAWRETQDGSREFYRALIHLSGGFFQLTQGRTDAAVKFFARARHWLSFFPNPYHNIDTDLLHEQLTALLGSADTDQTSKNILEMYFPPIRKILQERSP